MRFGQVLLVLFLGVGFDVVLFFFIWMKIMRVERAQRRIIGLIVMISQSLKANSERSEDR